VGPRREGDHPAEALRRDVPRATPQAALGAPQHAHPQDDALDLGRLAAQVQKVTQELFPTGTEGVDQGRVLRAVFLHLKRQNIASNVTKEFAFPDRIDPRSVPRASDLRPKARQSRGDNVVAGIPVGQEEDGLFAAHLAGHDFSAKSRRAFTPEVRKFAAWSSSANREPFTVVSVTTRTLADFRAHLRRQQGQAIATVNRALGQNLRA
jgi:hypothetical protein